MLTRVNPEYADRFEAQLQEAWDLIDWGEGFGYEASEFTTCIYARKAGTERNTSTIYRVCEWKGQFPRILGKPTLVASRQPIYGDGVSFIRVTYQSFTSFDEFILSEWEATLDQDWIDHLKDKFSKFYGA